MTKHTDSKLRRALNSVRRTWAEMERIQRRVIELQIEPRR